MFADGTATAWREGLTLTREQKEAAVAVIFYRGTECSSDGRERLLGVGLAHQKDGLAWCTDDANAYRMNITTIQCPASGEAGSLTFEGDLDGSDNLSQIGAYLAAHGSEDDTADAQKYPAFHYAKDYAAQADSRVAGTPFADGWYLPALAELFQIWKNREGVEAQAHCAEEMCLVNQLVGHRPSTLPSTLAHATSFSTMGAGTSSTRTSTTSRCVRCGILPSAPTSAAAPPPPHRPHSHSRANKPRGMCYTENNGESLSHAGEIK